MTPDNSLPRLDSSLRGVVLAGLASQAYRAAGQSLDIPVTAGRVG
ncbi:hypothetical protein SEA_CEPENS_69 [Mycobacterium phage Cepens]|nr:hypothetical protein SEA_CEPENS_69 [Mycobacterium phage Cepens]